MTRKIAFACDHAATHCREQLMTFIKEAGDDIEVVYLGPADLRSVDYPDYAARVAKAVLSGEVEKGILACGTGIGMSIAANKFPGIRASLCHDHVTALLTRQHNDANILCVGERTSGMEVIREMIHTFLRTPFSTTGRHKHRIAKITMLEKESKL